MGVKLGKVNSAVEVAAVPQSVVEISGVIPKGWLADIWTVLTDDGSDDEILVDCE